MGWEFLQLHWIPLVSGLLLSVLCGLLGPFVVLKKLGLLADTVAHASIFGIAIGILIGVSFQWTLIPFAAALGILLSRFSRRPRSSLANLSAVAFTLFLGFGTLILSLKGVAGEELLHLLFGDLLGLKSSDFYLILLMTMVTCAFLFWKRRPLLLALTNEDLAVVSGIPTALLEDAFLLVTTVSVALCVRFVGVLLASALIVLPPLLSASFAYSFRTQLWWSPLIGALGLLAGMFLSFRYGLPVGPSVSTILGLFFLAVAGVRRA